ncbi:YveK family protein [Gottfriedia solisilvae]|uniref:Capsular polysaccharide biosynthesis protein n=1 Tax=Gottfriedia solisilvae TaxID=1516104 RepID=A0A8J3F1K4_9BACI|nr:Wzz/FepE/Etk N-terminal domain-containing protein [Gottfriedia solisilvae]GGI16696.1 capsular polysaccharide biosynthesis protein [Gottfriedia solisilvae]
MENELSLKKILELIKKRIWLIIVFSIFFSTLGGGYSLFFTKTLYETSSKLIVNATSPEMMNTLLVMIKEPSLLQNVVDDLDLKVSAEELSKQIFPESIGGSSIVRISVVYSDPELAVEIANSTANAFVNQIPQILGFKDTRVLSEGQINSNPINDDLLKNILLGLLVGLIAGVGYVFLLDFLDDSVRSEQDVEVLIGIPVLGVISKMNKKNTTLKKSDMLRVETREDSYANNEQKVISLN